MKTRIIIICCVLLAVVLIVGIIINSVLKKTNVKSFSLNDEPYYLQAIHDFPSDKYLGEVLTAKEAQEKAIKEWLDLFGDKINNEKPYQVFLMNKIVFGLSKALCQREGKAEWHTS